MRRFTYTGGFDHIMKLPAEDDGYVGDYAHPRFVSVLLQLGDLLDMDNDRFHPLIRECIGALPEMSERHFEKHQPFVVYIFDLKLFL